MRVTDLFLIVPAHRHPRHGPARTVRQELPIVGYVSSTTLIICILSLLFWQTIARVVRGLFLSIKEKEFVEAAAPRARRAAGSSSATSCPTSIGPIAVNTTLVVGCRHPDSSRRCRSSASASSRRRCRSGHMLPTPRSAVGTTNAYLIYFPGWCC